jgi:hypothetical protein
MIIPAIIYASWLITYLKIKALPINPANGGKPHNENKAIKPEKRIKELFLEATTKSNTVFDLDRLSSFSKRKLAIKVQRSTVVIIYMNKYKKAKVKASLVCIEKAIKTNDI